MSPKNVGLGLHMASPGKRLQERLHRFCGDRLHQMLVEARFDRTQPILLLPPAGDRDEDRVRSRAWQFIKRPLLR